MYGFNPNQNETISDDEKNFWSRAIILVDMNAFFASIEQKDFPALRGQPVAVTNGDQGSCIITCSYEARAYGIKTGMRLRDAKERCRHLIQRPARHWRYVEISKKIMRALYDITPDIEIFSVDEAFLDVTHCQKLLGNPEKIGRLTQQKVYNACGLPCSVGVSGDKTTAKYAAESKKPNGFTVIPPWEAKERLASVPVTELCGIGKGVGYFLALHGVYTCGDIEKIPISILAKRFGNLGRKIWYMCQGADPDPVRITSADAKSMGHGKVMPPYTKDPEIIRVYFQKMSEKLAERLRHNHMKAQKFFIGLYGYEQGWFADKVSLVLPTNDGHMIYRLCLQVMESCWHGEPVARVQVTALQPNLYWEQLDLFAQIDPRLAKMHAAIDEINDSYGKFTIAPARLLNYPGSDKEE